jgi:large subunit ribosomal protein L17
MRHKRKSSRLGRSSAHLGAMLASLVCNLIEEKKIITTVKKAKMARILAERMVTAAKRNDLNARRMAIACLRHEDRVAKLFSEVVPQFAERKGGYTRVIKIGRRASDSSEMAVLEWVGITAKDKRKKPKKADEKKTEEKKQDEKKAAK